MLILQLWQISVWNHLWLRLMRLWKSSEYSISNQSLLLWKSELINMTWAWDKDRIWDLVRRFHISLPSLQFYHLYSLIDRFYCLFRTFSCVSCRSEQSMEVKSSNLVLPWMLTCKVHICINTDLHQATPFIVYLRKLLSCNWFIAGQVIVSSFYLHCSEN